MDLEGNIKLLTGNEVIIRGARAAGAEAFYGYPITPTTEILTGWAREAVKDNSLIFLQTEDEPAAGFGVIGSALGGKKSWTATAGVGHILMQDPLVLAEALRVPFVLYVGQRGGPSTGTVIYSQQELNLARSGGNGEGMRLVLAPSNLQELYDYTVKAFDWAWRYRFPVILLGDGYLSKMTGLVDTTKPGKAHVAKTTFQTGGAPVNLRNCYSQEFELAGELKKNLADFARASKSVCESEVIKCNDADIVIFAWGTVAGAAKEGIKILRESGRKVGLFRPVTLRPFDVSGAKAAIKGSSQILICESASGQFGRLVTESLFGVSGLKVSRYYKPAEGIIAEEIVSKVKELYE
jgi:2-oxoglutarate ferredoxin oxidoreductase subunit alpha